MNSPSNSPVGGRAEADDLLTPAAFALYAGRGGKVWVEIAGGGQKRH
jgi:hypothetical protein